MRDDTCEIEPAVERQLRQRRQVGHCVSRPVVRPAEALVGEELDRGDRGVDALCREPDHDGRRPGPQRLPGKQHGLGETYDLEGVVGAAVGQCAQRADGARLGRRVDRVVGATCERELELRGVAVDDDDRVRPCQLRRGEHLQTDPADTDHHDALARPDAGDVAHRPEPGDDTAAEERRLPQRQPCGQGDRPGGHHDRAFREACRHQAVLQRRPVEQGEP